MRNKSILLMVIVIVLAVVLIYFLFTDKGGNTGPVAVNNLAPAESSSAEKSELFVYTWADYIKPELVQRFEKENNCRVTIDTFDSNEAMYSKLKAGATGYDIITPSSYMVTLLKKQGMIIDLDHAKIPNISNVDPDYLKLSFDPDMKYSVPYMFSVTGIGYLKSKVKDFKSTWGVFDRKDLKGRVSTARMQKTLKLRKRWLLDGRKTWPSSRMNSTRPVLRQMNFMWCMVMVVT
jgi:spermidine/putrescine transport system substrate-binding protein